jgi:hypothetical protein
MATTITAPSHPTLPRWFSAAVAAVAVVAILVGLTFALSSNSSSPATDVAPRPSHVVGVADHAAAAAAAARQTPAEARRSAADERSSSTGERRVPARAF